MHEAVLDREQWRKSGRREERFPVSGRGILTWDDGSRSRQVAVEVRDISDGGVLVVASTPVGVGNRAYLTGIEFRCIGVVRHCEAHEGLFRIGLKFSQKPNFKNSVA